MKINELIVIKWNSFVLCIASIAAAFLWVGISANVVLALVLFFTASVKLYGIFQDSNSMRLWGLIGQNMVWGILALSFMRSHMYFASMFSIVIAAFGVGISVQERFNKH